MGFTSVLAYAHKLVKDCVQPGDAAVDATVGRGNDTVFLAACAGSSGKVYGFDIQAEALQQASAKAAAKGYTDRVHLFEQSHADMAQYLPQSLHGGIAAVMFNLGYLPGGANLSVITRADSTIAALMTALALLRPGGICTIVAYPGHDGGDDEAEAVRQWAAQLPPSSFQVLHYGFMNQTNRPPFLIAIMKK